MKITKKQIEYIKGFAIIIIIAHNFFHWTNLSIGENEFNFNKIYFDNYLSQAFKSIAYFLRSSFSYFGHYGVQLFIFCSGFGLYKSQINNPVDFITFIKKRCFKIYPVFILVSLFALTSNYFFLNYQFKIRSLGSIILRLTPIINWIPKKALNISGPFWFYSMILQLYLLFFPLIYLKSKKTIYFFITIFSCLLFTIFTNEFFINKGISLYYNFVGNLTVFSLGIFTASTKKNFLTLNKFQKITIYFVALTIFFLGQLNYILWHLTQVSFLIISIALILKLTKKDNNNLLLNFIGTTGKHSMYLFASSGFLRHPWISYYNSSNNYIDKFFILFLYIIIIIIAAKILMILERIIINNMKLYHKKT